MKQVLPRSLVVLVSVLLLDRGTASADQESAMVSASVITPFFGAYEVEATARASDALGLVVNASYLSLANDDWKTRTGTVGAGVNYYLRGSALRRWYVEVIGELMFSSWRHQPSGGVAPLVLGYSGIALVGYKFVWDRGPVLDVGAGIVALRFPSARLELAGGGVSSGAFTRVYPAVKVNVGWALGR